MAQQQRVDILLPVGRIVMGDLYKARDKDAEGKPLVIKNGPDAGKPRSDFFFAVAIPKEPGHTAWWQTAWGQQIMQAGAAAFPQVYQTPSFAWKIDDGDSQIPNKRGRKPADNEGWPGHWILKLSGGFQPKVYAQPSAGVFNEVTEPGAVKAGYWVQARINAAGNGSISQPGIYLNHAGVLFVRPDKEIVSGPDAATMFGGAAVSAALPGVAAMPSFAGAPGAAPAMPAPMGAPAAMQLPTAQAPAMPAAAPTAVAPNPAFLGAGVPAAAAPAMPMAAPVPMAPAAVAPAVPAEPQLTPKGAASGFTYAQYRQSGWTDEQLRGNGLIV